MTTEGRNDFHVTYVHFLPTNAALEKVFGPPKGGRTALDQFLALRTEGKPGVGSILESSRTTYPAGWTEKGDFKIRPTCVWTDFEVSGGGVERFWTIFEDFRRGVSRGVRGFGSLNEQFFRVGRLQKSPISVQTRVGRFQKSPKDVQNAVGRLPNFSKRLQTTVGPILESSISIYPAGYVPFELSQLDLSCGMPFCRALISMCLRLLSRISLGRYLAGGFQQPA